ncbi:hypothetical protein AHAS_Ahas03G0391400 [Arachis hypogaea]
MAIAKLVRKVKPYGLWVKMTAVTMLGLCFIFVWGVFLNSSSSITTQRESFEDIIEPSSSSSTSSKGVQTQTQLPHKKEETKAEEKQNFGGVSNKEKDVLGEDEKNGNSSATVHQEHDKGVAPHKRVHKNDKDKYKVRANEVSESDGNDESEDKEEKEESEGELEGEKEGSDRDSEVGVDFEMDDGGDSGLAESLDQDSKLFEDGGVGTSKGQFKGPLFDPNASYKWKLCSTRSKHNYIPCIDIEVGGGKVQSYRHTERSCPRAPVMCLVPLPHGGYGYSQPWPESKSKILFKNVAHPRLAAYMKKHSWLVESGEYLTFPQNQSEFKGGIQHYLESIEEMVPDIEWGKTIRVVLEIGCSDSSFVVALLDKDVLTLTLGLKHDLVDLAQVALERGFPAVVSPFGRRRLPFPSQAFDAIHCGGCSIPWHSNGGKLLFEMNRILRPSGYFIMSTKHDSIEEEEAMTSLTASICWNVLAHKSDDVGEVGVKIYQKPEGNEIYELRRKKIPPLCKESENPDAAWSYLNGLGINWPSIRNVMDMKTIYGGFAAALSRSQPNVWVMNVVPVHAPDTLPIIFERGLIGVYHDWCESFGTYPRTYDLLHADHLFSRLKNRCKQPVSIVVEMDRMLRPGGWSIIRDKVEILNPLEEILRSMKWEIRMTFAQDKEGILCAQKTIWRP